MATFVIEPHFRLQEWVAEEKGYFAQEGLDYVFRELVQATDGQIHDRGDRVGAYQSLEAGRAADVSCACHWTVGRRRVRRPRQALSRTPTRSRRRGSSCPPTRRCGAPSSWPGCRSRSATSPAATTRRSRRSSRTSAPTRSASPSTTACSSAAWSSCIEGQVAGGRPVQRPVLLRRAARLPQDHRHHLHDHDDDPRPAGPRGPAPVLPGAPAGAARHRRPARPLHPLLPERVPGPLPSRSWTPAAGARASASCSSPTRRRSSTRPSSGSPSTGIFADGAMGSCEYEQSIAGLAP